MLPVNNMLQGNGSFHINETLTNHLISKLIFVFQII